MKKLFIVFALALLLTSCGKKTTADNNDVAPTPTEDVAAALPADITPAAEPAATTPSD